MLGDFTLNIFPQGMSASVFTTVWVGVCVTAFFNLRFGWVLSGLVVPGYLAPLVLTKPWSAGVVVLEGVVTYFLVWLFSERLSRFGVWTNLFGRDRFFALLMTSVVVRLAFDSLLLPEIGEYLVENFDISFDYRNNLYSFGLIIVALIANQFWKPGPVRGMAPIIVTVGVTVLVVRFVLMEFTNFSLANLSYMYEDLAVSMLASPKAYIILLCACWVASRMNLRYGWEYNGILIPALLALQWYQPLKIAASFLEAFAILAAAGLVLRLPMYRGVAVEGARKILLFFNVSFAYKLGLGYLMLHLAPQLKVSDFYGFGYLLPSLLAIKMHDKDMAARVTRASLQSSLVAVVLASVVGYGLTYLPDPGALAPGKAAPVEAPVREVAGESLYDVMRGHKVLLYRAKGLGAYQAPLPGEVSDFGLGVSVLAGIGPDREPAALARGAGILKTVGYEVTMVEDRYLVLSESGPPKGWGVYVLDTGSESGLLVQAPAPLDEWGVMESSVELFQALGAHSLALGGTGRRTNPGGSSDMLRAKGTIFQEFQDVLGRLNTLQVRGYTPGILRRLALNTETDEAPESSLWVKNSLPSGLDLAELKDVIGAYEIRWRTTPMENRLRNTMRQGFAELFLTRADRRDLSFRSLFAARDLVARQSRDLSIEGYLQDWLLTGKERFAEKGSGVYRPASLEELLFMDQEVVTPLTELARNEYRDGKWTEEGLEELRALAASAGALGYEIIRYHHEDTDRDYLILAERDGAATRRFWGTYVFRLGVSRGYVVQVPRPLFELNVFEYGVHIFERLQAEALLFGTTHPHANPDGSADLIRMENKLNLFNLVSQTLLRQAGDAPMMVVHCRAFGRREGYPSPRADVVIAAKSGVSDPGDMDELGEELVAVLAEDGFETAFAGGGLDVAGYEVGGMPQSQYMDQADNKEFVILWLSREARAGFRQRTESVALLRQFKALSIPVVEEDLFRAIGSLAPSPPGARDAGLKADLDRYVANHDILALSGIKGMSGYRLKLVLDLNTRQTFLVVTDDKGRLVVAANLFPRPSADRVVFPESGLTRKLVEHFLDTRAATLEPGESRIDEGGES